MTLEAATEAPSANGSVATSSPRSCPVCGGPVPEDRKVTCSSECAQKRDHHGNGKRAKPTLVKAQIPTGLPLPASPALGLCAAAVALVDSLGESKRLTIELDAGTVVVTRAG
jgi:predicted nucleic acid-binding Zn ribbon protein